MPNWVRNRATLYCGSKERLNEIINDFKSKLIEKGAVWDNNLSFSSNYYEQQKQLVFTDFMTYPQIFEYDTTNYGKIDETIKPFEVLQLNVDERFFKYTDGQEESLKNACSKNISTLSILTSEQIKTLIDSWNGIIDEQQQMYGCVGWYDFNRKFFGCKWNCGFDEIEIDDVSIIFEVETPWSPAEGFWSYLLAAYSDCDLEILVRDEGDNFMGTYETVRNKEGIPSLKYTEAIYGENTDNEFFAPWEEDLDEEN